MALQPEMYRQAHSINPEPMLPALNRSPLHALGAANHHVWA